MGKGGGDKGKGKGKGKPKRGGCHLKARVKKLTQEIIQFAKRKRLADAKRVFKQLVEVEGLTPTQLTFSSLINAHVASGDMIGAEKAFDDMQSAGISANSIIYNTLFKGYGVAGNTARTAALFKEMIKQDVIPDTNTVNAYLRGCLRAGDVEDAHMVFEKMTQEWSAEPDFFTYKRVVQILSRGLRMEALRSIHRKLRCMKKNEGSVDKSSILAALVWLQMHMGLSAALLGEWSTSKKSLQKVEAAGAAVAVSSEVHLTRSNADLSSALTASNRGQHEFHYQMFEGEMKRWRDFLESHQVLAEDIKDGEIPTPDLLSYFCRTFIFGTHTNAHGRLQSGEEMISQPTEELAVGLARSLTRTFGLDMCVEHGWTTICSMENRFRKRLKAERIHWRRLFKSKSKREDLSRIELPVKLEICSGFGEWVIAQAKAEAGIANWGALELRYDRVHNIFSRMVFEGVENLCVLGGDAAQILPRYLAPDSVDHIFVNFPEPPQTNMLSGAESKFHLLTRDFFKAMHQVLRPGGRLTILHDEYKYCCLLARTVAALNDGQIVFQSVLGLRGKGKAHDSFEDIEGIRLYYGAPGKKSGHAVSSTSYFDSLWETKERYFLVLEKS